jgi:hypothetical protein
MAGKPKATRRPGQHRRKPGPVYSEAARRLWLVAEKLIVAEDEEPTAEMAARVRVSGTTILRWLYGERRAYAAGQLACSKEWGINQELWFVKPKGKHAELLPLLPRRQSASAAA